MSNRTIGKRVLIFIETFPQPGYRKQKSVAIWFKKSKGVTKTSISFFKKGSGSFSFNNCLYAYDAYSTHVGICIKIHCTNLNNFSFFPCFSSPQTVKCTSDVYTNNRCNSYYYPLYFFNILITADHYMRVVLAASTMECFHFNASKDTLWTGSL